MMTIKGNGIGLIMVIVCDDAREWEMEESMRYE